MQQIKVARDMTSYELDLRDLGEEKSHEERAALLRKALRASIAVETAAMIAGDDEPVFEDTVEEV